ncbi:hypothetical protein B0T13DRAFT_132376 [Neurospora crassa]|nr:hypothetical protein B0T13DRAFT_132376 [Neurospora crassa]
MAEKKKKAPCSDPLVQPGPLSYLYSSSSAFLDGIDRKGGARNSNWTWLLQRETQEGPRRRPKNLGSETGQWACKGEPPGQQGCEAPHPTGPPQAVKNRFVCLKRARPIFRPPCCCASCVHHHRPLLLSTNRVRHRHLLRYQWVKQFDFRFQASSPCQFQTCRSSLDGSNKDKTIRWEAERGRMLEVLTVTRSEPSRVQNPFSTVPCNLSLLPSALLALMLPLFTVQPLFSIQEASSPRPRPQTYRRRRRRQQHRAHQVG